MDLKKQIESITSLVRAGKGEEARAQLSELTRKRKIPRAALADLAQLAWRASAPKIALQLLRGVVYPSDKKFAVATDKEIAEYAAALIKEGAVEEALRLLEKTAPEKHPQALLYQAFGYIAKWDYGASVPVLQKYRKFPELTEYQRLVCDANLIAAYVFLGDFENADTLSEKVLSYTGSEYALIRARLLELKAESLISRRRFAEAREALAEAESCLTDRAAIDHFFIRKYQAVCQFLEDTPRNSLELLAEVRSEAERRSHWETIRNLDRTAAIERNDASLFLRVYFGTPFAAFREALLKDKPANVEIPDNYDWSCHSERSIGPVFDLDNGTWKAQPIAGFIKGSLHHRLLTVLSSDFYRPQRMGTLFARAFPGERYIPSHSSMRVRKALSRLRSWLAQAGIPLEIRESDEGYCLQGTSPLRVRVGIESKANYRAQYKLDALKKIMSSDSSFSADEAARWLNVSKRTAQRLLTSAVEQAELEKKGRGSQVSYRFRQAG